MSDVYPDYPDVVLGIVTIDCKDPELLAKFWGELLGRTVTNRQDNYIGLEWAPKFGAGLGFQPVPEPKAGKNRVHVDVICQDLNATVARVEELGGKRAPGYSSGDPSFIVMLDPEGNEFCLTTFNAV